MGINSNEYILEMKNISKAFPGVQALDDVTLRVRPGTVHALIGENGAGKSTLMKSLFGIYSVDAGEIILDGEKVEFLNSKEAMESGVSMVHQELNQALTRSVLDNVWLGRYPTNAGLFVSEKKMLEQSKGIFEGLALDINPKQIMGDMPVSQRQMVEIAKAVSYDSKIIVFDEPTSSLTDVEVEHLFKIINQLKAEGVAIIYISHKMEEILSLADEVTVLRDGHWVTTEPAEDMDLNKMIRLMVGRELTNRYPDKTNTVGDVMLEVKNLTGRYTHLQDVSFVANKGEVLGVAGLDGAGKSELLETIFGVRKIDEGTIKVRGEVVDNSSSGKSIKNGFALITEERRATGIFPVLNIRENTTISSLGKNMKYGLLSKKQQSISTDGIIEALNVRTPHQEQEIANLSGGNQQKVIIGRWLLTEPDIFLMDEPTRGIDVGAKFEIYEIINQLAMEGKTVIIVSSEMPELLGVSDRIIVMSGGILTGEVDTANTTQEEIMTYAAMNA